MTSRRPRPAELAAMLRAARHAGASTQPIDRRRLALGVLVLAASATALSATEISGFSHARDRGPFLSLPHGFVTPREYQWSAEESRMRALRSSALVVGSSLAIASGALAQNAVQWRVEDGGNGHWYRLELTYAEWDQARLAADSIGGHLATITSAGENSFIQSLTSQAPPADYYLGGFRQNQSCDLAAWTWITGESFEFSAWGVWGNAEPDCIGWSCQGYSVGCGLVAEIIGRPDQGANFGKWNDESKGIYWQGNLIAGQSIVEWSADCNSDGIVDYGQIRSGELADANGNYIPDCCESTPPCGPCLADVDGSGAVNGVDLAAILNTWGTSGGKYPGADVNSDGIVNGADLAEVLNSWGPCP